MSFLYQQVHSFLNLGICKEYPIMAKAKTATSKKVEKITDTQNTVIPNGVPLAPVQTFAAETGPRLVPSQPVAETAPQAKKTEVSIADQRAVAIPVTVQEEIRVRAYELYAQRGYSSGNPTEDWLVAEREVLQRYNHHSA
jgi:Protein of unknown function (DUF2934)